MKQAIMESQDSNSPPPCHANSDGECEWIDCPQLKDFQIYCPLAKAQEEFYGDDWFGI